MDSKSIMFRARFRENKYTVLYDEIRGEVYQFLEDRGKDRFGGRDAAIKISAILASYILAYILIFIAPSDGGKVLASVAFGILNVFVFFNISHDAIHGALFRNKTINNLFCYSADLIGVSSLVWRIKHNRLHHSFTNIFEHINTGAIIRLNSSISYKKNHRFQTYYTLFLYAIYSLYWIIFLDIKLLLEFRKDIRIEAKDYVLFFLGKVIYLCITVLIPYIILMRSINEIALCFVFVHLIMGLIVSTVSVVGHDFLDTQNNHVDENGIIRDSWFENTINTTADFEANSKIFSAVLGGLNLHISHHLFPEISHVHYPDITKIVYKKVSTHQFKINSYTFPEIITMHLKSLHRLSKPIEIVSVQKVRVNPGLL